MQIGTGSVGMCAHETGSPASNPDRIRLVCAEPSSCCRIMAPRSVSGARGRRGGWQNVGRGRYGGLRVGFGFAVAGDHTQVRWDPWQLMAAAGRGDPPVICGPLTSTDGANARRTVDGPDGCGAALAERRRRAEQERPVSCRRPVHRSQRRVLGIGPTGLEGLTGLSRRTIYDLLEQEGDPRPPASWRSAAVTANDRTWAGGAATPRHIVLAAGGRPRTMVNVTTDRHM